ncbi:DUF4167 domain-containing protein [Bradyrhizobium prioriisuperbiae]|uniref:DUF4167 domain-containing protein n=1 Tax=Bradyrhizobium prioriisuperbiae TaxID=2854389 RepID=UPI0028E2C7E7|nr:DUF4167 domain-containing protein [Bradyrhizobium prioritasuperba]
MTNSNSRNSRPQNTRPTDSVGSSRSSATNPQNAQRNYERYLALARNEADRVVAENYLQHAEHYFRSMREMTT